MIEDLDLSICVPALNEEKSLKEAVEELLNSLSSCVQGLEIIVVNDGSTDNTLQVAQQLIKEHSQVKVINHKNNLGVGMCYQEALTIAKGNYFTWFPADHENSAEEFILCLPYASQNTIVFCYHNELDPRSALRRFISRSYTQILNKCFHLNIKYYNGLTVFPTSVLRSFPLISKGFFFNAEGIIKAIKRGCGMVELLIPLNKRTKGKSKALTLISVTQIIIDFFCILLSSSIKFKKKQIPI